jgi:hypothetical protein
MSTDMALGVIRQQVDNYFDQRSGFTEDFDGQALIQAFCDLDILLSNGGSIPTEWS